MLNYSLKLLQLNVSVALFFARFMITKKGGNVDRQFMCC
jgi:hypothetical protein